MFPPKGTPPTRFAAWNIDKANGVATEVILAGSSQERRTGLLRHAAFPKGSGLWIAPCEAIHTFAMKFPIDVIFLDRQRRVVKICPRVKANRICFCWRAKSVLELPAGTIADSGTRVNDRLEMRPAAPPS